MTRMTITLTDDLAKLVKLEAKRHRTSFSEVVRNLIARGLGAAGEQPREIPWAGMFHDPGMVHGERLDEELASSWVDDIDRDRG